MIGRIHDGSVYDKARRRTSDEIKRIAGHQSQGRIGPWAKDRDVLRRDNFHFVYRVQRAARWSAKYHSVATVYVLETPEKAVAMAGNSHISFVSGSRSASNVTNTLIQREIICSLQDRDLDRVVRSVVLRKRPERVKEVEAMLEQVSGEISRQLAGSGSSEWYQSSTSKLSA